MHHDTKSSRRIRTIGQAIALVTLVVATVLPGNCRERESWDTPDDLLCGVDQPGVGSAPFTVSATATSGLAVTFSVTAESAGVCTSSGTNGATIAVVATGTCTVRADQGGNATYDPHPRYSNHSP